MWPKRDGFPSGDGASSRAWVFRGRRWCDPSGSFDPKRTSGDLSALALQSSRLRIGVFELGYAGGRDRVKTTRSGCSFEKGNTGMIVIIEVVWIQYWLSEACNCRIDEARCGIDPDMQNGTGDGYKELFAVIRQNRN